mmetsp:Transcript_36267/g.82652  ORF Transcript_36267/g.82652 Transcript_36267/m.82652 type:complete len:253 (+) Transcript_36267:783-1541(+)
MAARRCFASSEIFFSWAMPLRLWMYPRCIFTAARAKAKLLQKARIRLPARSIASSSSTSYLPPTQKRSAFSGSVAGSAISKISIAISASRGLVAVRSGKNRLTAPAGTSNRFLRFGFFVLFAVCRSASSASSRSASAGRRSALCSRTTRSAMAATQRVSWQTHMTWSCRSLGCTLGLNTSLDTNSPMFQVSSTVLRTRCQLMTTLTIASPCFNPWSHRPNRICCRSCHSIRPTPCFCPCKYWPMNVLLSALV